MSVMPSETKIRNSTSLSETTSIPVTLIWGPPDPRVACGHEAFRVIEPEWKKGEAEKKQTNKNKLTLGWAPPLFCCEVPIVWNCLLSMKKKKKEL